MSALVDYVMPKIYIYIYIYSKILVNSSNYSKLKPRHLSRNSKGSKLNHTDKMCFYYVMKHAKWNDCCLTTHTHTHTHIYIYIYI